MTITTHTDNFQVSFESLYQMMWEVYAAGKADGQPIWPDNLPDEVNYAIISAAEDFLNENEFKKFKLFIEFKLKEKD